MHITSIRADWFQKNLLGINMAETSYNLFRHSRNKNDHENVINLNNTKINYVSSAKFLGVRVDENLGWSCHLDNL